MLRAQSALGMNRSEIARVPGVEWEADSGPRVAVVIVNYRTPALAIEAVRSLEKDRGTLLGLHVIVVDGGSGDGSDRILAEAFGAPEFVEWVSVLPMSINGGFGWANNQAILRLLQQESPPAFIHLLNPDAMIEEGSIRALLAELEAHPRCAAVGSLLIEADGKPSGSAFRFPTPAREFTRGAQIGLIGRLLGIEELVISSDAAVEADWVTGASVLFRSEALREVGLFDDGFFLYFEEVELMWRLRRAGWTIRHEPASRVVHIGGAATGVDYEASRRAKRRMPAYWFESRRRFFVRTHGRGGAVLAAFAWAAAAPIGMVRALAKRDWSARFDHEFRDHLRLSLAGRGIDDVASVPAWNDPFDVQPAWMRAA